MSVFFNCRLSLAFDPTHLLRIVIIVGERPVDICQVEIVAIGDGSWIEPPLFDLFFDELNGNPPAFEMWLVVEFLHDTSRHLAHNEYYAATILERLDWAPPEFSLPSNLLVDSRLVVFRAHIYELPYIRLQRSHNIFTELVGDSPQLIDQNGAHDHRANCRRTRSTSG